MWGNRYFGNRFYGQRYWGHGAVFAAMGSGQPRLLLVLGVGV